MADDRGDAKPRVRAEHLGTQDNPGLQEAVTPRRKEHAVLTAQREKMDKQLVVTHNATLLMEKVQGSAKFA